MATIKQTLQDILTKLSALTDLAGSPALSYVRVFNDQFKQMEEGDEYSFPLPCGFVEMETPIQWNQIGGGLKQADVTWKIHIGMEQLDAGDGTMEQNLDVYDELRDVIIAGLTGYRPTGGNQLFQTAEEPDSKHNNVYHMIVHFKNSVIDSKGSPYDPANPKYIYRQPPTGLEVDNSVSHDPIADDIVTNHKEEFIIEPTE